MQNRILDFLLRGAVEPRLLKFSNRFTAYSSYLIDLKLGRISLDINLHNRYEQTFLGADEGCQNFRSFRGRHFYMFACLAVEEIYFLDLRDDRSVRSVLFFSSFRENSNIYIKPRKSRSCVSCIIAYLLQNILVRFISYLCIHP